MSQTGQEDQWSYIPHLSTKVIMKKKNKKKLKLTATKPHAQQQ